MLKNKLDEIKYRLYRIYYRRHIKSKIKLQNTKFNRIDILKYIQEKIKKNNKNFSYLEIGVQNETVFKEIITSNKIGVDPVSGGTHKMTSDEFFDQNEKFFDLIFIDGLHEYNQCKKDLINSVNFLNPGGIIVFTTLYQKII